QPIHTLCPYTPLCRSGEPGVGGVEGGEGRVALLLRAGDAVAGGDESEAGLLGAGGGGVDLGGGLLVGGVELEDARPRARPAPGGDRKSTRLNSSHVKI